MLHAKGEKYNVYVANIKEHLENKTSQDLLKELDQEFGAAYSRGELIDSDLYCAYMDVIDEMDPIGEDPTDPTALFEQVQQNHPELFSEPEPQTKKITYPRFRAKRLLSVAVVAIGLILALMAAAYGTKTMNGFNALGGDLFQIGYGASGRMDLDDPGETGYYSLEEVMNERGKPGITPTWIPEEYSLVVIDIDKMDAFTNISAAYSNGEEYLVIRIVDYSSIDLTDSSFERIGEYDEVYRVNSIDHFLMLNNERVQAVWENHHCLCTITGSLSAQQLKDMIDSIYERKETP